MNKYEQKFIVLQFYYCLILFILLFIIISDKMSAIQFHGATNGFIRDDKVLQ